MTEQQSDVSDGGSGEETASSGDDDPESSRGRTVNVPFQTVNERKCRGPPKEVCRDA